MLRIAPHVVIENWEIKEAFIRASGPGGQNVNKVASAVKLSFDVRNSPSLPEGVKRRLLSLAGKRITEKGVLIIDARRFRTQERNRKDALERLVELIRKAAEEPKPRRKTRPTHGSKLRRLESKHQRSAIKRMRRSVDRSKDSGSS